MSTAIQPLYPKCSAGSRGPRREPAPNPRVGRCAAPCWSERAPRFAVCGRAGLLMIGLCAVMPGCTPRSDLEPFQPKLYKPDYARPLGPGELALRRISPEEYPDFSRGFDRRDDLIRAVEYSLQYLAKPSSRRYFPYGEITHEQAVASLREFLRVLRAARDAADFDRLIRERFDVYRSVGFDGRGTVYYTGYYTPIFDGRKTRDGRFRFPLYRLPPDLLKDDEGQCLGRKLPDGRTVPRYLTRREIEEHGVLRGHELAWLKDPFEAYVITVQGSARLRLADGSLWELGYAGNNGHDYTPVSAAMISDGAIQADELSLQTLLRYFREHPADVPRYTWRNDRYVFFKEARGGPFGSINVPVTPYRSIATDKQVFPRACLAFLDTTVPIIDPDNQVRSKPYAAFALDQDTGGAIRAAGRCDIFMGIGPSAEAIAGRTGAEGMLYYIFLKPAGGGAPSVGRPAAGA
jgi:membrane-bound lytic murein transglycosylase A